ncbi:MAG: glycosyltransferase family 2 protein [Chitinophagales bacterium]|nr:glycosyltransferase family 2 protein [Chitinophagales bacterium]
MNPFDYSVVVPVYNSEQFLPELFARTKALFDKLGATFQMVLVDDASKDYSWAQILKLKEQYPQHIKAVRLAGNCGQQKATLCGINNSEGKMVVTIDDDLQIPPEEIEKLLANYRDTRAELVYGLFDSKRHSFMRNVGSWAFNKIFALFASTSGKGSSFRLMTSDIAKRFGSVNQKHLLLDEVLHWFTNNISYVNVNHHARNGGASGYTIPKLIAISLRYIVYYTVVPLRLMTYIGFIFSLISFIIGVVFLYNRLVSDVPLGFTSIIVAITFSTSLILFSLGIIGEYISRFYVSEFSRPSYEIKEIQ